MAGGSRDRSAICEPLRILNLRGTSSAGGLPKVRPGRRLSADQPGRLCGPKATSGTVPRGSRIPARTNDPKIARRSGDPTKIPRIRISLSRGPSLVDEGGPLFSHKEIAESVLLGQSDRSSWTERIGFTTRRSEAKVLPLPPKKRWSAPLVHGHGRLTSGFAFGPTSWAGFTRTFSRDLFKVEGPYQQLP